MIYSAFFRHNSFEIKKKIILSYQDNMAVKFALDYLDPKRLKMLVDNGIEAARHLSIFVSCPGSE